MDAKLAEWKIDHPSSKPSVDHFHAIMDKAKEHGYEGGMAITRDLPDEIRNVAANND